MPPLACGCTRRSRRNTHTQSRPSCSRCCAKALNYLEVYFINRDDLLVIASRFPATYKRIRQHIVKLAIRRMIVLMTREKEHLNELRLAYPEHFGELLDRLLGPLQGAAFTAAVEETRTAALRLIEVSSRK